MNTKKLLNEVREKTGNQDLCLIEAEVIVHKAINNWLATPGENGGFEPVNSMNEKCVDDFGVIVSAYDEIREGETFIATLCGKIVNADVYSIDMLQDEILYGALQNANAEEEDSAFVAVTSFKADVDDIVLRNELFNELVACAPIMASRATGKDISKNVYKLELHASQEPH